MSRRGILTVALVGLPVSACAYYNAMWSAERLAREARRQEANALEAEARLTWGRAATKAESVLARHPRSRWADDALVLQGEGLARSGACLAAAQPLERALAGVSVAALRERAALAAAECALRQGELGRAERLVVPVLTSRDNRRRSAAAYLAGRAAFQRGAPATAAVLFARSELPEAGPARVRALVAAGRPDEAGALMGSVARRSRDGASWIEALDEFGRSAGAPAAADALDRLLEVGWLAPGARARLLLGDGERLRAARQFDRAAARYAAVVTLVPDSQEAGRARVRVALMQAAQARVPTELDSLSLQVEHLVSRAVRGGAAELEARALLRHIGTIRTADSTAIGAFRGAELARDTLAAPELAASLFLQVAARYPGSLFAPKALIAAGQLRPEVVDSVETALRTSYAQSPYTQALYGAPSPAFQALEDSLAIAYGVTRPGMAAAPATLRFPVPRTGPLGPEERPEDHPEDRR